MQNGALLLLGHYRSL